MVQVRIALPALIFIVTAFSSLDAAVLFEGDIILTPEQEMLAKGRVPRTGLLDEKFRWPKNSARQVIVPYTFETASGYSE
jgi:hypothetical protein